MAFNPNDMTTDGKLGGWWPSKRVAENTLLNACCESQLILVKYNLEKISKKLAAIPSNEKLFDWPECEKNEFFMWYNMMCSIRRVDRENVSPNHTKSCDEIMALVNDISAKQNARRNNVTNTLKSEELDRIRTVHATEIDFVIHRKDGTSEKQKISIREQDSIFDEMTKWVEFNKWGPLLLRGQGMDDCLHEKLDCTSESEKQYIDGSIRKIIRDYRHKGVLLYFEMRENLLERAPDEKIELQEVELVQDSEDFRPYGESISIPIQTSLSSKSMFDAIGRHFDQNEWLIVTLTGGKHIVDLYDMSDDNVDNPRDEFDRKFMDEIQKMRKDVGAGIRIELLRISSYPIDVVVYDANGHPSTEKITLRSSIFDQLTKCVEFEKWKSVILRGCVGDACENFPVYDIGSKAEFEQTVRVNTMCEILFNIKMKQYIMDTCRLGGGLLHFEIQEIAPDIENQYIEQLPGAPGIDKSDVLTARFQSVTWV